MTRITRKDLEATCRVLNRRAGFDPDAAVWNRIDGRNVATVGVFVIDGAYGGWALQQILGPAGSVRDVFRCGHVPARELDGMMRAYLDALDDVEYGRIPAPAG